MNDLIRATFKFVDSDFLLLYQLPVIATASTDIASKLYYLH